MKTFHLHIEGIVQGVGFRPYVYRKAKETFVKGTVSNTTDGVHIFFNMDPKQVDSWVEKLLLNVPERAAITRYTLTEGLHTEYPDFTIIESRLSPSRSVLLTPDFAICKSCALDIKDSLNRRNQYPFTTCTVCGPRYAIIKQVPYDRDRTSMDRFTMCEQCCQEYENINDRRYYSQTNSCQKCGVSLSLTNGNSVITDIDDEAIQLTVDAWEKGEIVAIKGIGGYLLTCDSTNKEVIQLLRKRKNRPVKPFAVMYHDFFLMAEDVDVDIKAMVELQSQEAPIVLLPKKEDPWTEIEMEEIAPEIGKLGVMLPYTPLFRLLLDRFQKPIIATSGNLSGDPISFTYQQAMDSLPPIADLFLHHNLDLCIPQDDSVVNISPVKREKIILRRSRGMAPTLLGHAISDKGLCVLAMGGLLKSTFGLVTQGNIYISQYLGDTDSYQTQQNYKHVLSHMLEVLQDKPEAIICDQHPAFFSSLEAERLSKEWEVPLIKLQHHEAHFYAVMGEYHLQNKGESVLGIIWDGVGLGHDSEIWGGELLLYEEEQIRRLDHLPYFPYLLGDKMSKEPRLSALSLLFTLGEDTTIIREMFSDHEWDFYHKILQSQNVLQCSSMGRVFDAVACILLGQERQTFEGEAAMKLENEAHQFLHNHLPDFRMSYLERNETHMIRKLMKSIIKDKTNRVPVPVIAAKFHISLVHYIDQIVTPYQVKNLSFSGGVFQNAWLHDSIHLLLGKKYRLYFHQDISPNDENIAFGQLIYYLNQINNKNN